jgi:hypothetical protein
LQSKLNKINKSVLSATSTGGTGVKRNKTKLRSSFVIILKSSIMDDIKLKLQALIANSRAYSAVDKILKEETVDINRTQQPKLEFLGVHERRLKRTMQRGKVVPGLEELIDNLKNTNAQVVIIYSIWNDKYAFAIYTDDAYSKILGVI